jgi:hypothetical protein
MEVAMFRISKGPDGQLHLRAQLKAVDSSGNPDPSRYMYHVKINDLTNQMDVTPKFADAWDRIVDVMGLAYDFYRIKEKLTQAIAAGEDTTALVAARDAALAALRAPVE